MGRPAAPLRARFVYKRFMPPFNRIVCPVLYRLPIAMSTTRAVASAPRSCREFYSLEKNDRAAYIRSGYRPEQASCENGL